MEGRAGAELFSPHSLACRLISSTGCQVVGTNPELQYLDMRRNHVG